MTLEWEKLPRRLIRRHRAADKPAITMERNLLTQKVLFAGRRERIELIVISLEIIRAIIDSLVRVRVSIIGCLIITVMDKFVVVAERLFLIGGEIILFEVLVGL